VQAACGGHGEACMNRCQKSQPHPCRRCWQSSLRNLCCLQMPTLERRQK
jgi:hypothetical protein